MRFWVQISLNQIVDPQTVDPQTVDPQVLVPKALLFRVLCRQGVITKDVLVVPMDRHVSGVILHRVTKADYTLAAKDPKQQGLKGSVVSIQTEIQLVGPTFWN